MASVIVDPGISGYDTRILQANEDLLARIGRGWKPDTYPDAKPVPPLTVALGLLSAFLAAAIIAGISGSWGAALLIALVGGVVLFIAAVAEPPRRTVAGYGHEREVYECACRQAGHYVLSAELDTPALHLLSRARKAVASVLGSHVVARDLLDGMRNESALAAEEWQIARLLALLSDLRADSDPGLPASLADALDVSEARLVARVEALERYARRVDAADQAYLSSRSIDRPPNSTR